MKFYFRVKDRGETKQGCLTAADKDTAFALLVQEGKRVLELREATRAEITAENKTEQPNRGVSPSLETPQLVAPTGARKTTERVLLAVALLGFVGFLFTWRPASFRQTSGSAESKVVYTFEIEGKVPEPRGEKLMICFQEIPLTLQPGEEELELGEDGDFKAKFSLELDEKPLEFSLSNGENNTPTFKLEGDKILRGKAF